VADELVDAAVQRSDETSRIVGVAVAVVSDNVDLDGLGRVEIELPWNPRVKPWARVATLSAGGSHGTYFLPQVGDEVLVAFNQGDIRDVYIVGGLWNAVDRPPFSTPDDPVDKRAIRTPVGHRLEFTELDQSVVLANSIGHRIEIGAETVELATQDGAAKITLGATGDVTIQAQDSLTLTATSISLQAQTLDISADVAASIDGGASCTVQADLIELN